MNKEYIEVPNPSFRILSDEEVKQQEEYRNSEEFIRILEKWRKEIVEDIINDHIIDLKGDSK